MVKAAHHTVYFTESNSHDGPFQHAAH
jgi:hypothetical protein